MASADFCLLKLPRYRDGRYAEHPDVCLSSDQTDLKRTWSPGVRRDFTESSHRMIDRSPRIRTRAAAAQPQHLPPNLNHGLRRVVPPYPIRRPYMLFLFVGSQL